jgi:tetratricopeptide (TPR) repeat protein
VSAPTAESTFADPVGDLEAAWRDEASRHATLEAADEEFSRGLALHEAGRSEDALPLLASASRAPGLRFAGASLVARIHRDRGNLAAAVDWFERAAQAPATTTAEGLALLYELADALEQTGEAARALAICIELQSEAGRYRDVAERIDRLFKAQPRG